MVYEYIMEIKTLVTKEKVPKRTVDQAGDTEMEDVHASKKEKNQDSEEDYFDTTLVETIIDHPSF